MVSIEDFICYALNVNTMFLYRFGLPSRIRVYLSKLDQLG
jgi:hypothetical protein